MGNIRNSEFIISKTLLKYLEEINYEIPNKVKAKIIYSLLNTGFDFNHILSLLNKLANSIEDDDKLKADIISLASILELKLNDFKYRDSGSNSFIYILDVYDKEYNKFSMYGIFSLYDNAFKAATELEDCDNFIIYKQRTLFNHFNKSWLIKNIDDFERVELKRRNDELFISYVVFDKYTDYEEKRIGDIMEAPVFIPHPFQKGDIVKISRLGYGVICNVETEEEYNDRYQKYINLGTYIYSGSSSYLSIIVDIINEDDLTFYHYHSNALEIELVDVEKIRNKKIREVLIQGSSVLKGNGYLSDYDLTKIRYKEK